MSRRGQGIVFGIITGLWALILPFAALAALTSVMMSDAGANRAIYAAIGVAFGGPLLIVLCGIVGWIAFAFRRPVAAAVLFAAPLIYFVAMLAGVSILLDHGPRSAQPWG
jgi:hypothetical protein